MKLLLIVLLIIFSIFFPIKVSAQVSTNSYVSVVNPVRGQDFWDLKEKPIDAVKGQMDILQKNNVPTTWLIRFDALNDQDLTNLFQKSPSNHEKGLFLEITPTLTQAAGVRYNQSTSWHSAQSVLLTGYSQDDRKKLIETAFDGFKNHFGFYPKSVGAWWIDAFSLDYMQKKYQISGALIVADQYSTDNYQIWGQYFGSPYYPMKRNALAPAQDVDSKIPVVVMQWASRDPVNGYGKGVEESTYSVQANDYIDYHNLDINYFGKLIDVYTNQKYNQINQIVVGLENSYSWQKYQTEYQNQINLLKQKSLSGQLNLSTMQNFAAVYKSKFPNTSPTQILIADDPLGTDKKSVWFMNNYYRVGWFYNQEGSVVRDIRQYIGGSEEICFSNPCTSVNFATFATRVLDDVTYHQKWLLDEGKITNLNLSKIDANYVLSYKNSAELLRKLEFLPRDISWEGKPSTVDGLILNITSTQPINQTNLRSQFQNNYNFSLNSILNVVFQLVKFLLFIIFVVFVPGFIISRLMIFTNNLENSLSISEFFISIIIGLVGLTLFGFVIGLLKLNFLIYLYLLFWLALFIKLDKYKIKINFQFSKFKSLLLLVIISGSIFQVLPVFQSGLIFNYGLGLWGPNTHDGIWHMSLINQLVKNIPPQNPIYGNTNLENYHYFYDLMVALAFKLTQIPISNLIFQIFPFLFSVLLGLGSYNLSYILFRSRFASIIGLFLIYFAGSFGFIVSILKHEEWGGESAFWANQSISFNLNPPFAVSILILIAILLIFKIWEEKTGNNNLLSFIIIFLSSALISFKAYAAILLILTYIIFITLNLRKKIVLSFIQLLIGTLILTLLILIPQYNFIGIISGNTLSKGLFIFSPFWFIHSMIDNPDRVGWLKLSAAREAYLQRQDWFKFFYVEVVGFSIFIIGNLGIRFLGILEVVKLRQLTNLKLLIIIYSLLSILIPILFIQTGTPWNTIQFFYYGMFFASIFAGSAIIYLYKKMPVILGLGSMIIILVIAPISSITTAKGYLISFPHSYVSQDELAGLNFLKKQPDGLVLTYPFDKAFKMGLSEPLPLYAYDGTAYVSALSNKASFLEDESQNQILQTDYTKRQIIAKEIFNQKKDFAKDQLTKNNIKYIYLLKIFNKSLNEQDLNIVKIFENKEVMIYKIK